MKETEHFAADSADCVAFGLWPKYIKGLCATGTNNSAIGRTLQVPLHLRAFALKI